MLSTYNRLRKKKCIFLTDWKLPSWHEMSHRSHRTILKSIWAWLGIKSAVVLLLIHVLSLNNIIEQLFNLKISIRLYFHLNWYKKGMAAPDQCNKRRTWYIHKHTTYIIILLCENIYKSYTLCGSFCGRFRVKQEPRCHGQSLHYNYILPFELLLNIVYTSMLGFRG